MGIDTPLEKPLEIILQPQKTLRFKFSSRINTSLRNSHYKIHVESIMEQLISKLI